MGVEAKVYLLGHIKKEEIIKCIYDMFCKDNIRHSIEIYDKNNSEHIIFQKYQDDLYSEISNIYFHYKDKENRITYLYNSYRNYSLHDTHFSKSKELVSVLHSELTCLSMGGWQDNYIEILTKICEYFGGYFHKEIYDVECLPYYIPSIQPEGRKEFPPVIYLTQEELNKHFGGIVVIKD